MLTILFYLTGKPDAEPRLRELLTKMTQVSRGHEGCISYTFHQQHDDPRQWMLLEQWRDRGALDAHISDMKVQFGDPPEGARLPARLHELAESHRAVFYKALA